MSSLEEQNPWVWVIVQDPGGNEQFLGQRYEDDKTTFIPAFREKEEAQACLPLIQKDQSFKYEVQAIRFSQLAPHAAESGFMVFILDGSGHILDKIKP